MSDNKITQDQLESNVMEELESGIGDLSTLSTENKDSLVAAVTEIYGKNVIAEAIGEPLAVTDTFAEMGNEINSLLSSFKTNMMNSGVTVESGDKFKQLIDKIKGLTEGEGNKGIQFAQGEGNWEMERVPKENAASYSYVKIPLNLSFEPTIVFCYTPETTHYRASDGIDHYENIYVTNLLGTSANFGTDFQPIRFYNLTKDEIEIRGTSMTHSNIQGNNFYSLATFTHWWAIGVGEEDTTLRDSLADILENKGVDVTEEDDMASLITKVDRFIDNTVSTPIGFKDASVSSGGGSFILSNDGYLYYSGFVGTYGDIGGLGRPENMVDGRYICNLNFKNVKKIRANQFATFALKEDGTLWVTGCDYAGEMGMGLGTSGNNEITTFTKIMDDVNDIAVIANNAIVFKNDGTLWGAGDNDDYCLGISSSGSKTTFTQISLSFTDIVQMSGGYMHFALLRSNGEIWVSGSDITYGGSGYSTFNKVSLSVTDISKIACGAASTFALTTSGDLYGFGGNKNGELGLSNYTAKSSFTLISSGIKDIIVGPQSYSTFIVKSDGQLMSAGRSVFDSDTTNSTFSNLGSVKNIIGGAAGSSAVIFYTEDGKVYGMSSNRYCIGLSYSSYSGSVSASFQETFKIIGYAR